MDHHLLPDIFDFLAKHRPELGKPDIVFLGGSQVTNGGIHKTKDSDYDTLVLFPNIERAESFSFTSDDGQRSYDLILRDKSTLAYDVINAQNNGRGTILHIIAQGTPLYDPKNLAADLKDNIKELYNDGPHIIDLNGVKDEIYTLNSNLFNIPTGAAFTASLAAICNHIALHALRFSGRWASSGKIGGRFLNEAMPQFSASLRIAFDDTVKTRNEKILEPFPDKHLPLLYFHFNSAGRDFAPPKTDYPYTENPTDLGEVTTAVRLNLNAMAHYLKIDNEMVRRAAITWAHLKIGNAIKPLSAERFERKPEEYFLALGKAISSLSDIHAAHTHDYPNNAIMVRRIAQLFADEPAFAGAFDDALHGDSCQLKTLSDSLLSNLNGNPLPNLYRPSRADMRADEAVLIRTCCVS